MTHRGVVGRRSSSSAATTRRSSRRRSPRSSRSGVTLVVLMGLGRRAAIAARLDRSRLAARTRRRRSSPTRRCPISRSGAGTLERPRRGRSRVPGGGPGSDIVGERPGIDDVDGPASIVIGGVAALDLTDVVSGFSRTVKEQRNVTRNMTNTHGRARLSFASEADIDEFVATLERYERGEITPDQWRAFRLVRGTYGQRQADDAQMLRVKIPQGVLTADQLDALADVGEQLFARLRPHHDAAEHPVPLREAARRRAGDAAAGRRRADDARGVRQLGAQHHGVPVRRRRGRRALRRHAVRRGADAVPAAASAQLDAAAQVQDRVRGLPRGSRRDRDQRPRLPRGARRPTAARGFRVTAGGGTAIMCKSAGVLHEFLPASEIFRVAEAVLRVFQQLGDYKHKQRNRMKFMIKTLGWDALARGVRPRAGRVPAERRGADCSRSIRRPSKRRRTGRTDAAPSPSLIASRVAAAQPIGPGHHADARARLSCRATRRTRAGARPTCGRRSSSAT